MIIKAQSTYSVEEFMNRLKLQNAGQSEFHQAVQEFVEVIIPFINTNPKYQKHALLERLTEPDRVFSFRVAYLDDNNEVQVTRGYRVQFNNAIGPYKGGLRFHPSVNVSILKFLGFEQIFKNSLTTLAMGGGKGGANFDPKGKSNGEIMRFCQSFMTELHRYIGPDRDVPAGDIGVGSREIGYLFGHYKRLRNEHTGVLTGKGLSYGGSLLRPEATGYGTVYFMEEMLKRQKDSVEGKRCVVSGSGNVAQYTAEKLLQMGASVHSLSDSSGVVYDKEGLTQEKLEWVMDLKNKRRGRIKEYADEFGLLYIEGGNPWQFECDLAFPSATQNEINEADAKSLVKNGCIGVAEGANMPTTPGGIRVFQDAGILYGLGKAANAGGVATSGLEMAQNSNRIPWSQERVNDELHKIMINIHDQCLEYGTNKDGSVDYVQGANIAGFVKVADAMIAQGVI